MPEFPCSPTPNAQRPQDSPTTEQSAHKSKVTHEEPEATHIDAAAKKPLPPAIAVLVDNATAYSSDNLQRLTHALSDLGPSQATHPRIIKLLLAYLKERVPFANYQSEKCPELALLGIRTVIQKLRTPNNNNNILIQSLTQSWPDIWFWMNYKKDPNTSATLGRLRLAVDIIAGICSHFPGSSADRAILSTPGVCSIVVDVWVQRCDQMSTEETLIREGLTFPNLLFHLVNSEALSIKDMHNTPRAQRRTSSMLLKMIQMSAKDNAHWASILPKLMLLAELLAAKSPELGNVLLSQDSIGIVCRAIAIRSSQILLTSQPAIGLSICLYICFDYLISAMLKRAGHIHIIRAVHAGLIPSLLRCGSLKFDDLEKHVIFTLQKLTEHTVHLPLLKACRGALEDPVISSLEDQIPKMDTFWKTWTAFKISFRQRLAVRTKFYELEKCACNSDKCSNKALPGSYRICSGCLDVHYCSKACQKYDWKEGGHRDHCKAAAQSRAEGTRSDTITAQDRIFFTGVAMAELAAHAESRQVDQNDPVLVEIAKNIANGPPRNIMINLASSPTTFDKGISTPALTELTGQYKVQFGAAVPDPGSPATRLNVVLVVPYGGSTYETVCVQYISNEFAGAIFARDAPKPII